MTSKKSKIKELANCKIFTWLTIVLILLILIVTTLSLQQYLYRIQINERIRKVEDYTDFVLTILPQKRKTKIYQFEYENTRFYFDGIEQVYINYKTTKIFFEEAIKRRLLSINDVISHCILEKEDENVKTYHHINIDDSKNYFVTLIEEDSLITVIFSK